MAEIVKDSFFDSFDGDDRSFVFEVNPRIFGDERGSFSEVMKDRCGWSEESDVPMWMSNCNWIRQINRSKSGPCVIRGCHAQKGSFCQGKLVEAVNTAIFDIITDGRPDSKTFGKSKAYRLDPNRQNKLWVPRGFLHSFAVPENIEGKEAVFQYYCDNVYSHGNEFSVNPMTVLPEVVEVFGSELKEFGELAVMFENTDKLSISDKDRNGMPFDEFKKTATEGFDNGKGKPWYR